MQERVKERIAIISIFIVILTMLIFFAEFEIDEYQEEANTAQLKLLVKQIDCVNIQVLLAHYLEVVGSPDLYNIYNGGNELIKEISRLKDAQKTCSAEVGEFVQENNNLIANGSPWEPIRYILYLVMFALTLLNSYYSINEINSA